MAPTVMDLDDVDECPLCQNEPDLQDRHFRPCTCPYWICMFCYDRICQSAKPVCPNCQKQYTDETRTMTVPTAEELEADRRRRREKKSSNKASVQSRTRKPNDRLRIVERTIVHITPVPDRVDDKTLFQALSRFGKINRLNRPKGKTTSVLVTFSKPEEARNAILQLDERQLFDTPVRAMYGLSRYCAAFINDAACPNQNCGFRHEQAPDDIVFTEEEVKEGKHFEHFGTSAVRREHEASLARHNAAVERARQAYASDIVAAPSPAVSMTLMPAAAPTPSTQPQPVAPPPADFVPPSWGPTPAQAAAAIARKASDGALIAPSQPRPTAVPDSWEQHDADENAAPVRPAAEAVPARGNIRPPPGYENVLPPARAPSPFMDELNSEDDINMALLAGSTPVAMPTAAVHEPIDGTRADTLDHELIQLLLDETSITAPAKQPSSRLSPSVGPLLRVPDEGKGKGSMTSVVAKLLAGYDQDAVSEIELGDITPASIIVISNHVRCNLLQYAIHSGSLFLAQYALDKHIDPNWLDPEGFSCVHLCVVYDRPPILQLLLERGRLDLRARCRDQGQTALHLAVRMSNFEIVGMLLDADSSLALERDDRNWAPLDVARDLSQTDPSAQATDMLEQLQMVVDMLPPAQPRAAPTHASLWGHDATEGADASEMAEITSSLLGANSHFASAATQHSAALFSPLNAPLIAPPIPTAALMVAGRGRGARSPPSAPVATAAPVVSQPAGPPASAAPGAGRGRGRGKPLAASPANIPPVDALVPAAATAPHATASAVLADGDEWLVLAQEAVPDAQRSGIQPSVRTVIQSVERPITAPKRTYKMPLQDTDIRQLVDELGDGFPKDYDKFRTFALFTLRITERASVERLFEALTGSTVADVPRPLPITVPRVSQAAQSRPTPAPIGKPPSSAPASAAVSRTSSSETASLAPPSLTKVHMVDDAAAGPSWLAPATPAVSKVPSACHICGKTILLSSLREMHMRKHEEEAKRGGPSAASAALPTRPKQGESNDANQKFAKALALLERLKVPEDKAQFVAFARRTPNLSGYDDDFLEVLFMTFQKQRDLKNEGAARRGGRRGGAVVAPKSVVSTDSGRQGHKPSVLTPTGRRYCYFYQLDSCSAASCSFAHEKDPKFVIGKKY